MYVSYSNLDSVTTGPSLFVDITSDSYGNYYALDGKRGRVFAYDVDGNLLYAFGALGKFDKKKVLWNPLLLFYVIRIVCTSLIVLCVK